MKVVLCGNYGATNLGDEMILKSLLQMLKRSLPDASVVVMSNNPKLTEKLHGVSSVPHFPFGIRSGIRSLFTGSWLKTLATIKHCDLFILGGGGLFTDEKFRAVPMWFYQTSFARFFRKPIAVFGVSIGPLNKKFARKLTRKILSWADFISVRDKGSFEVNKKIVQGVDPVFLLDFHARSDLGNKKYVIIILRPWISHCKILITKIDQFIDWVHRTYGLDVVLVPFQKLVDDDEKLMRKFANKNFVQLKKYTDDFDELFSIFSHAKAIISMRLHGIILAAMAHTPFIAIDYSDKVSGIVEMLTMKDFSVALEHIGGDELEMKFQKVMKEQERIRENLRSAIFRLQEKGRSAEQHLHNFALTIGGQ